MADKTFTFDGRNVVLRDPATVQFDSSFIEETYQYFFGCVAGGGAYTPQIDIDGLGANPNPYDIVAKAVQHGEDVNQAPAGAANFARTQIQYHVRHFLETHPEFFGLLLNSVSSANISIANAGFLLGQPVDRVNFIRIKRIIDVVARRTWSRQPSQSERQSGVSVLGQISENLLGTALNPHLSDNLFKVTGNKVKSYGDFVAICLPNNLWISVKSNFARERLLASGFSNDIVGAGFFVQAREFTSAVKTRNFQRAGFLAMYLPDSALTDAQAGAGTSTYQEVIDFYDGAGTPRPQNINGKPFLRPLSELSQDIGNLMANNQVSGRLTVEF